MSYISAIRIKDDVLVWERTDEGREIKTFKAPYEYYVRSGVGEHTSMYGDILSKIECLNEQDFQQARGLHQSAGIETFESDLPPELKILSSHYYGKPAPALNITFYDIEVDYNKQVGFADTANPYAPINSVALYHVHKNEYVVLAVPPNLAPSSPTNDTFKPGKAPKEFIEKMKADAPFMEDVNIRVRFCKNERELLLRFLSEIDDSDVISGWNSDFFDTPYTGKRLEKIGAKYFRMLSFPEGRKPSWREVEIYGNPVSTLDLSGRISADYMVLFRKYEMAERPSYKLESIADEILPELPKLEYEGSLADLYRKDFAYFVRYNIRDTEILHGLENRLGYVDLANQMMHLSTGVWKHVGGTLKLAELATINYCHNELGGLIVNDLPTEHDLSSIQGAFVLNPQIGMHERIGSIDINSLYPSAIRAINISPETLLGQFENDVRAAEEIEKGSYTELALSFDDRTHVPHEYRGTSLSMPASEWRDFLREKKWAVSGFGTVFDQNKQGIIPKILDDWYATRKKYKKLMKDALDEAGKYTEDQAEYKEWKIKATYYDKLQYTYKIKLNSFYGALTNMYFRFFDSRMGESTTGTGRRILLHQCAKACEILDGQYAMPDLHEIDKDTKREHWGYSNKYSVVYGDTDSSYFQMPPSSPETYTKLADEIGEYVNDSFQEFMQETFLCNPGFDHYIACGREIVSDRGIFVQKKRYILHIIDNEGYPCDKLKVMGLDTKKTTLPKEISVKLNKYIERYLKGEDWNTIATDIVALKTELETTDDIMSIGLPKGIKKIEDYTKEFMRDPKTRLPGHVAAAIVYNTYREANKDFNSMPIVSGMKIKVFYLKQKIGRFKSVAIPVDIEEVPSWFLENMEVNREMHIERLVDAPLQNILGAIGKTPPSKQSLFVESVLVF